jgi:peroxiredoxin Q/BCP
MKTIQVGDKMPSFKAKDQNGKMISSDDFKGKKVAIYFYPKDNTPGCTAQACSLRDGYADLQSKGIEVIGVSADSEASHQKFIVKFDLPFTLISDEDHTVLNAFGVWGPKKFMGKEYDGIHRTTFLINEEQTVVEVITKPNTKAHADEILSTF